MKRYTSPINWTLVAFVRLFGRMVVRPLAAEPMRTALMVLAVALGVAVVIAIRLAGDAATGSFRSSLETLAGKATLEVVATGGIDEVVLGRLAALPHPLRFVPRMEGFASVQPGKAVVPLIGLDNLDLVEPGTVWTSTGLGRAKGDKITLTINDRTADFEVRRTVDSNERFVLMDIGVAQKELGRVGRIDRIEVHAPSDREWTSTIRAALPTGVEVRPFGTATDQNRRMLTAFRWNLRVLSYISLVVGGFLIYNTISVSVVRRRAEIGIVRALGGTRAQVMALFLLEAVALGILGSVIGAPLGRLMATGAVGLLSATVQQLYVSSTPGDIALGWSALAEAVSAGILVCLLAALAPASEAAAVAPVEAMARGRREHTSRQHVRRNLVLAAALALAAAACSTLPPWNGRPAGGYAATFLLVFASALAVPTLVTIASRARILGVPGLLAARSASAALSRTSVLVAALATAVAMLVSVGIMVGSFRETVAVWMEDQLQADLYLRPATGTMRSDVADTIERLPIIRAVDRFRAYDISYNGLPAIFAGTTDRPQLAAGSDNAIVSEPFANKHRVRKGDRLEVRLGGRAATFNVVDVYRDYSTERGLILVDRATLLRFLPDPSLTSVSVRLRPGVDVEAARGQVEAAIAGASVAVRANSRLRQDALVIFDRTFAVTWALEAVAIFVAVLGVAGALVSLVIDRRREIGVLRFLGASTSQIRSLILCEAGLLGLLANAVGLALGYALSLLLIYVINVQSFGWTIQFHWPVALLVGALTVLYIATVAAGLYPARIATRINPIEVIHEE